MQNKRKSFVLSSIPPTTEELKKYLDGQLSIEESKAFEKRLQSAEIFSEGIQGLELLKDGEYLSKITKDINKKIDQKLSQKQKFSYIPYWSVAAGVLLFSGLIFTVQKFQGNESKLKNNEVAVLIKSQELVIDEPKPDQLANADNSYSDSRFVPSRKEEYKASPAPMIEAKIYNDNNMDKEYADANVYEEVQSAPSVFSDKNTNASIIEDMIAFAEMEIHKPIEFSRNSKLKGSNSVVAPSDASTRSKPSEIKKEAESKELKSSSSKTSSPASVIANTEVQFEKESYADSTLSAVNLATVLDEIKKGNSVFAEKNLEKISTDESFNVEILKWLRALILLNKNQKEEAIIILEKLENSNSNIGKKAGIILEKLKK